MTEGGKFDSAWGPQEPRGASRDSETIVYTQAARAEMAGRG